MKSRWNVLFSVAVIITLLLGGKITPASAQTSYVTYIVQKGDTLGTIAANYCTTWSEIYDINQETIGSNPNIIEPGMVLTIPANCNYTPPATGTGTITDKGPMTHATGTYNPPYYTVAWGDTLFSIGERFGVPWQDIATANGIKRHFIYPGQVLLIPNGPVTPPVDLGGPAERVYFQYGATSSSKNGVIVQGAPKSYILWAQAGQALTVNTVSSGEALVISVGTAKGDLLPLTGTNSQTKNNVSAILPQTGDYLVTVRPAKAPENPQLNFTITFTIK